MLKSLGEVGPLQFRKFRKDMEAWPNALGPYLEEFVDNMIYQLEHQDEPEFDQNYWGELANICDDNLHFLLESMGLIDWR